MWWTRTEASWRGFFAPEDGGGGAGGGGGGEGGDQGGGAPSTSSGVDWRDGLTDDDKSFLDTKGYGQPADLLKAYRSAEAFVGAPPDQVVTIPGADADDDAWNAVYGRLGRPGDAAGYAFAEREGADADVDRMLAQHAHKWGLTPRQAEAMRTDHYEAATQAAARQNETLNAAEEKVEAAIKAEFGADQFEARNGLVKTAVQYLAGGDPEAAKALDATLSDAGLFGNIKVVKQLMALGEATSEDGALPAGGISAAESANAEAEIKKLEADDDFMKKFMDHTHKEHAEAVQRMQALKAKAGGAAPIQTLD